MIGFEEHRSKLVKQTARREGAPSLLSPKTRVCSFVRFYVLCITTRWGWGYITLMQCNHEVWLKYEGMRFRNARASAALGKG